MNLLDRFKTVSREASEAARRAHEGTKTTQASIAELRRAIDAKAAESVQARAALPPPAELIATAERLVDERGAQWWEKNEYAFFSGLAGHPGFEQGRPAELPVPAHAPMPDGARCALEPATMKALYREAIRARRYEAGLPAAERPARLEQVARELAELQALEEQCVDQANEDGVRIDHRPEVSQRRETERRQREAAEASAADRRQREAAIDAGHATRVSRVTRSSYLEPR